MSSGPEDWYNDRFHPFSGNTGLISCIDWKNRKENYPLSRSTGSIDSGYSIFSDGIEEIDSNPYCYARIPSSLPVLLNNLFPSYILTPHLHLPLSTCGGEWRPSVRALTTSTCQPLLKFLLYIYCNNSTGSSCWIPRPFVRIPTSLPHPSNYNPTNQARKYPYSCYTKYLTLPEEVSSFPRQVPR